MDAEGQMEGQGSENLHKVGRGEVNSRETHLDLLIGIFPSWDASSIFRCWTKEARNSLARL